MKSKRERILNLILPIVTILVIILFWAVFARKIDSEYILPSVSKTVEEFLVLLKTKEFYSSFSFTLLRSLIAFIISFIMAFVLAVLSAKIKYATKIIAPIISITRALPTIAIVLLLLFWTNSRIAPIIVTTLVVLPTVYTQIESAFFALDKTIVEAGRVDGANEKSVFLSIELPQMLPAIYTAVGSGISLNFKLMVAAEVIAQTAYSIGYMLNTAKVYFEIAHMLALVCFAVIFGIIVEAIFNMLSKKSARWK